MRVRLRTFAVFLLVFGLIYMLVKMISVYWVIVFFNIVLVFINAVFLFAYFDFRSKPKPTISEWPRVSIVIPNYNGAKALAACVDAAKSLEYPLAKQIIVVDDGSTDDSKAILSRIKGIEVISKARNGGKAAALNSGIRLAKGDIVATIDSDTFPDRDCLMKMVPHFGEGVGAVTGLVRASNPDGFIGKIQEIEYLVAFGFFQSVLSEINGVFVTPGPMSVFRRAVLEDIGGFDEENITEDMEIALRLQKRHYRIVAAPDAHIYTEVPTTIRHLFRQRTRWYRGKFANTAKYRELLFNPDYGEFGMFSFPFSLIIEAIAILVLVVTVAANVENVMNYFGFFVSWVGINGSFFGLLPTFAGVNSSIYFYGLTILMYSMLVYISHKFVDEDISVFKIPQIIFFLFIYGLFISAVYFTSFFKEINASHYTW
ncbi:MAG: glycosyltransferase family 2 protein [Candidatus Diapherotrites archaeon]|uniref:Glycosyltransferase family 2 protein n=1 Tax=Candidatus Iainarchaeum sp. TaxID=3101447 RepID=A0A8T3YLF4_9ARCH|nr:glycosyltransferase family 2 protein [Candidatus Diapherotrites archaeon]